MLQLENLKASVNDKKILNGLNLEIKPGEVHAIMGPNGSGKSTLSNTLAGKDKYTIESGEIVFNNSSIIVLSSIATTTVVEDQNAEYHYTRGAL